VAHLRKAFVKKISEQPLEKTLYKGIRIEYKRNYD